MTKKIADYMLSALILMMAFNENQYFGWHYTAQSDSEIICDMLIYLAGVISMGIVILNFNRTER